MLLLCRYFDKAADEDGFSVCINKDDNNGDHLHLKQTELFATTLANFVSKKIRCQTPKANRYDVLEGCMCLLFVIKRLKENFLEVVNQRASFIREFIISLAAFGVTG